MNLKALVLAMLMLSMLAIPILPAHAIAVPLPDQFTYLTTGGPETADPAWAYDTASAELIFNVYQCLLDFDFASYDSYVTEIAEWWPGYGVNAGNVITPLKPGDPAFEALVPHPPAYTEETWLFKIREGMKWQNSSAGTVTTWDVEYSIERGMVMDHRGGPQWMFFDPLCNSFGTRPLNYSDPASIIAKGQKIDNAVMSNATYVWFNLMKPYAPFQQILCQSWGSILDADWAIATGCWNASWHVTPGDYLSWTDYNNPVSPGPIGFDMMGSGPYYLDYIDSATGYFRLRKFDNYWGGWAKPHVSIVIHEVVDLWATRKQRFLSNDPADQADMVTVLRGDVNDPDLTDAIDDGRVRYQSDLASLSADAIFYCYDFDPLSPYMHDIGDGAGNLVANTTLLSDIHMRLALTYCLNITEFIWDYFQGEAAELHNPIIYGIAYANVTKHQYMAYKKDVDLATYHFKMAWGGIDADGDPSTMDDVTPGEVWTKGFHITIVPFPDQAPRTEPARMIEYAAETEIEWDTTIPGWAGVDVEVYPLDWSPGLTAMYSGLLGCYVVGWLADFPDPHNWVGPFEATWGDFSYFQNIDYGRQTMNWHTGGGYGQSGLPYLNYKGDYVDDINNTYVDGLIDTGMGIVDTVLREQLYNELMDIYYAECASIMTYQPEGRHYERTWVHGWFYHSIYPGLMFYGEMNIWKQDPDTVTRFIAVNCWVKDSGSMITKYIWRNNYGDNPEYLDFKEEVWIDGLLYESEYFETWIPPHTCFNMIKTIIVPDGAVVVTIWTELSHWHGYLPYVKYTTLLLGDHGGGVPPAYFKFDSKVDGKDLALFLQVFKGLAPAEAKYLGDLGGGVPPAFFNFDGKCDGKDLALFLQCFKGLGP
jgi:peptide/nickel transport system substrate-binding protein